MNVSASYSYRICPHHAHAIAHIIITLIIHAVKMFTSCLKLCPHSGHHNWLHIVPIQVSSSCFFNTVCIMLTQYV